MISTIVITGFLDDMIDKEFRNVRATHPTLAYGHLEEKESLIPMLYWTRDQYNPLTRYEKGGFVIIKGHLECDKSHGLFVLVETLHLCKY